MACGGGLTSGMDENVKKKVIAAAAAAVGAILGAWEAGAVEGQGKEEEEGKREVQVFSRGMLAVCTWACWTQ